MTDRARVLNDSTDVIDSISAALEESNLVALQRSRANNARAVDSLVDSACSPAGIDASVRYNKKLDIPVRIYKRELYAIFFHNLDAYQAQNSTFAFTSNNLDGLRMAVDLHYELPEHLFDIILTLEEKGWITSDLQLTEEGEEIIDTGETTA